MSGRPDIAQPDERLRQIKALEMRVVGMPWAAIAEQLGYADHSGAFRAVEAVLKRAESAGAAELRKIEDERLDVALRKLYPGVRAGDQKAIDLWLKAHDRRVKLHGLAAPTKVEVQNIGVTYEEFTTTVGEDMRAIGFPVTGTHTPVLDTPLTDEGDDDGWANT